MYDLNKFKNEDVYIRLDTLEKYNKVMEWLEKEGIKWRGGDLPTSFDGWRNSRRDTAIAYRNDDGISQASKMYYMLLGYTELLPNDEGVGEVTEQIERMGLEIKKEGNFLYIHKDDAIVAKVSIDEEYVVDTDYWTFRELDHDVKEKLLNLLLEVYEEPKYYWKLRGAGELSKGEYLRYYETIDEYGLDNSVEIDGTRTQFTKREFKELKKELRFTLEFEPEE